MRTFRVTVNGQVYDVEVEEVGHAPVVTSVAPSRPAEAAPAAPAPTPSSAAPAPAPAARPAPANPAAAPVAKPVAPPAAAQPKAAAAPVAGGGANVTAPLPGTILDVRVSAGQQVSAGQVLCILEAMKMENEISSPAAGTVAQVAVQRGQSVNVGDLMFVVK